MSTQESKTKPKAYGGLENLVWRSGGDELLTRLYPDNRVSIRTIARKLGVHIGTVHFRAKHLNLQRAPQQNLYDRLRPHVARLAATCSMARIAEVLNVSTDTISRCAREHGITFPIRTSLPAEVIERNARILELRAAGLTQREIALKLHVTTGVVAGVSFRARKAKKSA